MSILHVFNSWNINLSSSSNSDRVPTNILKLKITRDKFVCKQIIYYSRYIIITARPLLSILYYIYRSSLNCTFYTYKAGTYIQYIDEYLT